MPDKPQVNASSFNHLPVLAEVVINSTKELPSKLLDGGLVIDATIGSGGHSSLLLEAYPNLRIIGLDQDPSARAAASNALATFGSQIEILANNFADFVPPEQVAIVFADLGVSSPQLDIPERGFSFLRDGPLDMRMNPETSMTAAELIEHLDENTLANVIYQYGEERLSRRIARKIKKDLLEHGAYKGTKALAYAIAGCYPKRMRHGRIHPATRTFQALRIAVNNELEVLDRFLTQSPEWLLPGGLIIIISFHSLEDRKVKTTFLTDERLERVTRKPIIASAEEIQNNPRSRSAKCRIARKK